MLWGVSGVDRVHGCGRIRVPVPCNLPGGSPDTRLHLLSLSGINFVIHCFGRWCLRHLRPHLPPYIQFCIARSVEWQKRTIEW